MSNQKDLDSQIAAAHRQIRDAEASAPARLDLVVEALACAARRSNAFDQRRLAEGAVADTSVAVGILAVVEDTDRVAVGQAVDRDRGCHAAEEAGRMRHRVECQLVDSGRAKQCALGRMLGSEPRLE